MANSDFISWDDDDINLDLLLGEYTDYENNPSPIVLDDGKSEDTSVVYICPNCNKSLKSISGFRGHVTKKHGLNIKASDHRHPPFQATEKPKQSETSLPDKSNKSVWIPENVYDSIYLKSYHSALKEIENNPIHNLFGKSPINEIAEFCENHDVFKHALKDLFAQLANMPVNIVLSDDRETLFRKFHQMRLSSELTDVEDILKNTNCPNKDDISNFLQIFLMELTNTLLDNLALQMKTSSTSESKNLTDNDQKVLFYVSGFVIHALKKKYNKIKSEEERLSKLNVMDSMTAKKSDQDYIKKYSSLLERKNRGGLKHPCDNFFLLVRSMETVVRKNINSNYLTQNALNKCALKEHIMEDYMVKYYAEKISPSSESSDEDECAPNHGNLLEDIINMFLTVRGFAAARVQRNKIVATNKATKGTVSDKNGKSFRSALKEKCINA